MPNINRCFFTIPVASGGAGAHFFRKPPAVHRPLFMPPFAGDIGARAGSLKWTAQIPRKAYRWALRGDLKNCFLALNVGDQELEELFLITPPLLGSYEAGMQTPFRGWRSYWGRLLLGSELSTSPPRPDATGVGRGWHEPSRYHSKN